PSQPQVAQGVSSGGASPQATAPVQASAGPSTGGFVQADPSTNSLIITAPEPLYRQMRSVIDQLDSRRAQVYIESMIVEVNADNNADFGFQWQGIHESKLAAGGTNLPIQGRVPGLIDLAAAGKNALASLGGGLNIGILKDLGGGISLAALAHALQTQSKTNVMATPNLVTLDNEEAKIVVGDNVPFITGQSLGTGANANPFQTIERKDVGLTLRIKPQIGEGGTVRMTIFQESSDVKDQAKGTANAGPTTSKRSIESTVVVDDGQIIVLGGLIQDKYTDNVSKVPLLGDIPFLGHLFRSESRSKARTNLMVFIRPTVMRDADSAGKLSQDRYDAIRAQQQGTQPAKHLLIPVDEIPVLDTSSTRLIPPRIAPAASGPAP
ncbi:MAG TPA: type II secretion system secretin GspD, partial [Burkholderiaceae bacterium]|nr:type II secretion system secretin GspD [Burkholderiaceae bacterium]